MILVVSFASSWNADMDETMISAARPIWISPAAARRRVAASEPAACSALIPAATSSRNPPAFSIELKALLPDKAAFLSLLKAVDVLSISPTAATPAIACSKFIASFAVSRRAIPNAAVAAAGPANLVSKPIPIIPIAAPPPSPPAAAPALGPPRDEVLWREALVD